MNTKKQSDELENQRLKVQASIENLNEKLGESLVTGDVTNIDDCSEKLRILYNKLDAIKLAAERLLQVEAELSRKQTLKVIKADNRKLETLTSEFLTNCEKIKAGNNSLEKLIRVMEVQAAEINRLSGKACLRPKAIPEQVIEQLVNSLGVNAIGLEDIATRISRGGQFDMAIHYHDLPSKSRIAEVA